MANTKEKVKTAKAVYGAYMLSLRFRDIGLDLAEDIRKKNTLKSDYAHINFGTELLVDKVFGRKECTGEYEGMNAYLKEILDLVVKYEGDEDAFTKAFKEQFC